MIEVKSGKGKGISTQVANQQKIMGEDVEVIVYGPKLGGTVQQQLRNDGIKVFTSTDSVINYLKTKE